MDGGASVWRQWLERPERLWLRHAFFQTHYWAGMIAAAYVLWMSVTGGAIVFANELSRWFSIQWLVHLHTDLLLGSAGRVVNAAGAICLTLLCFTGAIIWWPGIKHWRRSLSVDWRAHFARINWDIHSVLGLWSFPFILIWGISGIYFTVPQAFNGLFVLDPADRYTDRILYVLSELHFGRFGWLTEILWTAFALAPAALAFTGFFICCRRVLYNESSSPHARTGADR